MLPLHDILLRLTFAAALGAAIGVEREIRRRPAGLRTSMLVCLTTALFTVLSGEIARRFGDASTTRIASNIVQGIGFLGAGAILREGSGVIGLTTAATVLAEAAIGMAVGGGLYVVGAYSAGLVLFGLIVLGWVGDRFNLRKRIMTFRVTTSQAENIGAEVQKLLAGMKIVPQHLRVSMVGVTSTVEFTADVGHGQQVAILTQLNRPGLMSEVIGVEGHHE